MWLRAFARKLYPSFQFFREFRSESLKASLIKLLADTRHKAIVEIEVMNRAKTHSKYFARLEKMADVCTRIIAAYRAVAPGVKRTVILGIFSVIHVYYALPCEKIQ